MGLWSATLVLTPLAARLGLDILCACRVVLGVAEAFCLPAVMAYCAAHVPAALRTRAVAVALSSGSLGRLLALVVCPFLPWTMMFSCFGGAGFAWCSVVAAVARLSWRRARCSADAPVEAMSIATELSEASEEVSTRSVCEASGQEMSGAQPHSARTEEAGAAATEASEAAEAPLTGGSDGSSSRCSGAFCRTLLGCQPLWAICVAHVAANWTLYTLQNWLPTYLHEVLHMPERSLWLSALPHLSEALGGCAFGAASDALIRRRRLSTLTVRRIATAIGLVGTAACHLAFAATSSPAVAIAVQTLSGLCQGATASGPHANHADISTAYAGLTFSVANTLASAPAVLAGPVTAWLVRATGSWAAVFYLAAALNVAATAVYVLFSRAHVVLR